MKKIILSSSAESNFPGFDQPLEVLDSNGNSVGFFYPSEPLPDLSNVKLPYSKEEIKRRLQMDLDQP